MLLLSKALGNAAALKPLQKGAMQNDEGQTVDLYLPRKCAWTHKLITAKDHASIQINIGHLNADGTYNGQFTTFALTGKVRSMGEADAALDLLWKRKQAESS
ncbi:40S ribosomal protein S21, partial [Haematococcus lacustris]